MIHPTDWTIDPERTAVFVYIWPNGDINHLLSEYLRLRFRHDGEPDALMNFVNKQNIVCARNVAMHGALNLPDRFETFVFCDNDLKPGGESDEMFRLTTDVKCCKVAVDCPTSWPRPDSFHDAFWCINREHLALIRDQGERFFDYAPLTTDGKDTERCMCTTFSEKAFRAGLTVGHAGHALHGDQSTWQ